MNISFFRRPKSNVEELPQEPEPPTVKLFLPTHPRVTRMEIVLLESKPIDILVWCEGERLPFSILDILSSAGAPRSPLPSELERRFIKASGVTLFDDRWP